MQKIIPTILLKQLEQLDEEIRFADSEIDEINLMTKTTASDDKLTLQLLMCSPFLVIL